MSGPEFKSKFEHGFKSKFWPKMGAHVMYIDMCHAPWGPPFGAFDTQLQGCLGGSLATAWCPGQAGSQGVATASASGNGGQI